jgi:hypothetical protein
MTHAGAPSFNGIEGPILAANNVAYVSYYQRIWEDKAPPAGSPEYMAFVATVPINLTRGTIGPAIHWMPSSVYVSNPNQLVSSPDYFALSPTGTMLFEEGGNNTLRAIYTSQTDGHAVNLMNRVPNNGPLATSPHGRWLFTYYSSYESLSQESLSQIDTYLYRISLGGTSKPTIKAVTRAGLPGFYIPTSANIVANGHYLYTTAYPIRHGSDSRSFQRTRIQLDLLKISQVTMKIVSVIHLPDSNIEPGVVGYVIVDSAIPDIALVASNESFIGSNLPALWRVNTATGIVEPIPSSATGALSTTISNIVAIDQSGRDLFILWNHAGLSALDPNTGKRIWSVPHVCGRGMADGMAVVTRTASIK